MSIAMKIPLLNSAIYSVIRKKLMDAFGGNVGIFIVGGAPMNPETESFLMKIKFPITIGYGMTECAPPISVSPRQRAFKAGSCGRFLKGLLEVRSTGRPGSAWPAKSRPRRARYEGCLQKRQRTPTALDEEGWLHTGDMATMDPDGTLYIRGRSKTMILSGNGNIYPEEIEDKLNNMYLVLESLVLDAGTAKIKAPWSRLRTGRGGRRGQERPAADHAEQLSRNSTRAHERCLRAHVGNRTSTQRVRKTSKRSIKRYLYEPRWNK